MKTANISAMPEPETTSSEATNPIHVVPRFLTRRDVARLFGVSASTVTRWARTGLLPSVRTPGGHYRYRAEDALIAARAAERGKEKAS
jgi:excisionase family DNA binding protein